MKRKLFLLLCALLTMIGVQAQNPGDDYTSYITNPTFTDNADGWTIDGQARYYNGKGFDGTTNFIELTKWGSSWDATISQTVNSLPNGYFLVKAAGQMSGTADCWMKLVANGAESRFSRNGDTNGNILANGTETTIGSGVAGWRYTSVIAKVTDGTLAISCVGHSDVKERWANFDAVKLTFLGTEFAPNTDVTEYISNWDFWGCFNDEFNGWTISAPKGGNTWVNGDTRVEYWSGTAAGGEFDYYQTITGLPIGKYTISASMWNSTNNENPAPAGVNETAGVYGTSGTTTVFKGVNQDTESCNTYTTEEITVTNGTLRLGVKNNGTMGARWFGVDWIKLTFVEAISLQDYYDQITALVGQAGAITGKQSVATADELSAAVTEGNALVSEASTDIEALNASIDRLTAAITASQTSVHSYAVIAAGVVPDNSIEGWVCENSNAFHINTWSHEGDPGNDPSGMVTPFIENWVGKGSFLGAGRVYYQLQGLNPGEVYYAQALVRSYNEANADAPNGPNFFINDDVVDMTKAGTTFTYNGMSGIYATLRGAATVGDDGTLTLGVQIADDRNYNWVAFKSISIRSMKDALNAVIEETEATIPTGNIGTGVFQYVSAAVSARQAKIDAAKAVYDDDDATQDEMEEQIDILGSEKTAVLALNDPDPEKRYCIVVATSGHAMEGKAVGIALGATSDNNPTGYSINTSNTTNQSVAFTKVSTNTYNISFVTAAGTTYMTYGSLNGSVAGWNRQQIQATTNATNKGEFKIVATATANVFNIYNTVYNANIDCQDNGSLYTDDNITKDNFTLVEATAANLAVSDGKLGTFIAPFDVVLPANVKAYSATSDESKVTLTKIAEGGKTLEAGTPVIIYGDGSDVDVTFYGVPTVEDNQPVGALVGILDDGNKTVPAESYVLQTQGGNQAFYKLNTSATGKLNRCYVISGSGNARLVISFDETTAINAIEAAEAEADALKDGKFLENGKIVIVKNGVKYSANGQILK